MTESPEPKNARQFPFIGEQWELVELLGEGGMSRVYRGRHKVLNREAAVKVLLAELVSETHHAKRFEQEARALSSLDHPAIVRIHDYGLSPGGRAYLIVDLLQGESLQQRIEAKGRLTPEEALPIFDQICEGVQHAHEKKIFHRDLKPSNIMLVKDDDGKEIVRIVDFGLSKLRDETTSEGNALTKTGDIIGTPFFMSPEQCSGRELDHRADIYAMGCLMYAALSGKPPFADENVMDVLTKHMSVSPDPLVPKNAPDSPFKRMDTITRKCLAKNKEKRYQTMTELLQDLREVIPASKKRWEQLARQVNKLHQKADPTKQSIAAAAAIFFVLVASFQGAMFYFGNGGNNAPVVDFSNRSLWIAIDPSEVKEDPDFEQKNVQAMKAFQLVSQSPNVTHGERAEAFNKLGHFYMNNGHWSEALLWFVRAYSGYSALGKKTFDIAQTGKNIGVCELYLGQYDEAEQSLNQSVALMEELLTDPTLPRQMLYSAPKVVQLLEPLQLLEAIYSKKNQLGEAARECNEITNIYRNVDGHANEKLLWTCESADIGRRQNELAHAEHMYTNTLPVWKRLKGEDSIEVARNYYALALVTEKQGHLKEAEGAIEAAARAGEHSVPPTDPLAGAIRSTHADILWKSGNWLGSLNQRLSRGFSKS